MADRILSVRNWDGFQHYKKKSPPWIKVYRDILGKYEFMYQLEPAERWAMVGFWLLAAEHDNEIPADLKYLSDRLRVEVTQELIRKLQTVGVLEDGASSRVALGGVYTKERRDREEKRQSAAPASEHAREGIHPELAEWLTEDYDQALPDLSVYTQRAIYGLVGPHGTRANVWGDLDPERRPPLTKSAIDSYLAAKGGDNWHQGFFLSIVASVVRGAKKPPPDSEAGRMGWAEEKQHYAGHRTGRTSQATPVKPKVCEGCGTSYVGSTCGYCERERHLRVVDDTEAA